MSSNKNGNSANEEVELSDDKVFCICKRTLSEYSEEDDDLMIECDSCNDWFHSRCVKLLQNDVADIDIYICPLCQSDEKQIIYKKRKNNHRHDYTDANAANKPTQVGTKAFIADLLKKKFADGTEVIVQMNGSDVNIEYFDKNGFSKPILVKNKSELDFLIPNSDFKLGDIENLIGENFKVDVIDAERQQTTSMTFGDLRKYFDIEPEIRRKVYNLISLEISKTKLGDIVTTPKIVQEISWVSCGVWPETLPENATYVKPEVQKYCLISAQGSYTDFHVDFGGSSVWYHIVKGQKYFYLIEPTDKNLQLYEKWASLPNHTEKFFANQVPKCYKLVLEQGDTIFLPTGWIHAVYTPSDSLVFGGNFEQTYSIPLQLKIYEIEKRLNTPEKYRFPAFETLHWYAARYFTAKLKVLNKEKKVAQPYFLNGCRFLKDALRKWLMSKNYYIEHGHEIPANMNCEKVIAVLNKELTKAEYLFKMNGKVDKNCELFTKRKRDNEQKEAIESTDVDGKPRLVLKIPKLVVNQESSSSEQEVTDKQVTPPIKLKISSKILKSEDEVPKEPEFVSKCEKIELNEQIEPIKVDYTDNDFIYPSIEENDDEDEAETSEKVEEMAVEPVKDEKPQVQRSDSGKRIKKIKPHAVKYLMKGSSSNDANLMENSEDDDYVADLNESANDEIDHDIYEDEEEFSVHDNKKSKKSVNGNTKQSNTSNKTQEIANKVQEKAKKEKQTKAPKVKKGYATSKQRLSKILKLNRIIHF